MASPSTSRSSTPEPGALDADVVICGGGLAGLTLARQLRRELPGLRVTLIERTRRPLPLACHKVGESSVELGSQYLERLGLGEYLEREHLIKFGLRFFPGGGHLPLARRSEIGPAQEPVVRSYQIDRGKFEDDLRAMLEDDGVILHEGAMVRSVEVGSDGAPHEVAFERDGERVTLRTRWVVDATGRNAFLKRRLKLGRGTRHPCNAGWFRVQGRIEIGELVPPGDPFHDQPFASERWRSTNHLMGNGYWVWLIPLAGGRTSVGIVTHDDVHDFDRVRTLERCVQFLRTHEPLVAERLEGVEVLDFRCLQDYSYGVARSWSAQRWGLVGEAGAFVDPLYSPGTDFIAYANSFTTELISIDVTGSDDLERRVRELNIQYRALVEGSVALFRGAAAIYGHSRAMAAKVYWDNFVYWAYACQYFLQGMYRQSGAMYDALNVVGGRYVELSGYMQALFRAWAAVAPETEPHAGFVSLPVFPSLPVDAHLDLQKKLSPEETLALMRERLVQAEEMASELVVRWLIEHGPERGAELLEHAGVSRWSLRFDPARWEAEPLVGLERRRSLSIVARDVERNFGPANRHPEWAAALELLSSLPGCVPRETVMS